MSGVLVSINVILLLIIINKIKILIDQKVLMEFDRPLGCGWLGFFCVFCLGGVGGGKDEEGIVLFFVHQRWLYIMFCFMAKQTVTSE